VTLPMSFSFVAGRRPISRSAVLARVPRALLMVGFGLLLRRCAFPAGRLYSWRKTLTNLPRASAHRSRMFAGPQRACPAVVILDKRLQQRLVGLALVPALAIAAGSRLLGLRQHLVERTTRGVATRGELAILVVDIGPRPPDMPAAKVAAGGAQHDHRCRPSCYSQPWSPVPSTTALATRQAPPRSARPPRHGRRPRRWWHVEHGVAERSGCAFDSPRNSMLGRTTTRRRTGPCRCSRWHRRSGTA